MEHKPFSGKRRGAEGLDPDRRLAKKGKKAPLLSHSRSQRLGVGRCWRVSEQRLGPCFAFFR